MSRPFVFCWDVNRWANASTDSIEHRIAAPKDAKTHRDLFLAMKRVENSNYSCFTKNEVRQIFLASPFSSLSRRTNLTYDCETQRDGTVPRLFLGKAVGNICLWEQGSIINWIARRDGYPSSCHANMVVRAAYWATHEWTKIMEGRVVFRYVDRFDDACFKVEYGGDRGDTFARSFFPDDWEQSLNTLLVFRKCFESSEIGRLRNVMLHELGHVLGMRHEHAHDGVKGFLPPEDRANGPESILWGARNPKSVMAYYRGQRIQNSDVVYLRKAYDELENGKILFGKGRLGTVKKIIRRVQPNN